MLISKEICDGLSDTEIIQKSLVQVDYFSCLYERYEERLLRYVKSMAGVSPEEAEDILQESFIKIWKNLNAFNPSMRLSSWIYRIVRNQAISCIRKKTSFGKNLKVEWKEELYDNIGESLLSGPLGEEYDKELLTQEVLKKLPAPYKEVLVLKFLENMTYEEISDVLKIPEGTVATRINRAKKAFAKISAGQHLSFDS